MFVAIGAISSVLLHAQTRIHGQVVEHDGTELPYALVSIYLLPDSTLVDYTSTNQKEGPSRSEKSRIKKDSF